MLGQKSCCMRRAFSLLSVHFWETSLVCSSEIAFFSVLCSSLIMFRYLLSVLQSHSLIVSCLSLSHLCNPPLHHLQLISTNNDYSRALVQSYKLMHTQAWCPRGVHKQTAHWTVLRDGETSSLVWCEHGCALVVWVMIHWCTVTATYQPEERRRHRKSSSVIFTLLQTHGPVSFFNSHCHQLCRTSVCSLAFHYCTWRDSGGDDGRRDHAPPRSGERCHLQFVDGGGGETGQLVLQGGVGQGTLLTTCLCIRDFPPQHVACGVSSTHWFIKGAGRHKPRVSTQTHTHT